jgi:hypothetical protein
MTEPQNYPRKLEVVHRSSDIYRLKVPGGWLVLLFGTQEGSALFIPDPNHEWVLEDE